MVQTLIRSGLILSNVQATVKISIAKARIELGNTSNIKWFNEIGEYRIDWGPGYRIYRIQDGVELILLLGGGTKKRQRQDIKTAIMLYKEYKTRMRRDRL